MMTSTDAMGQMGMGKMPKSKKSMDKMHKEMVDGYSSKNKATPKTKKKK
jgi:hypothetical protein